MEREWKLGEDLGFTDNVLDGITFEELVTTVQCNSKVLDKKAVMLAAKQILEIRLQDMMYLAERNADLVAAEAKRRRFG